MFLEIFLKINLLLIAVLFLTVGLERFWRFIPSFYRLQLNYALLLLALVIPVSGHFIPKDSLSMDDASEVIQPLEIKDISVDTAITVSRADLSLRKESYSWAILALVGLMVMGLVFYFKDIVNLYWHTRRSRPVKKIGRVHVRAGSPSLIPSAFSIFGRSFVVVPEPLLRHHDLADCMRHELQHIRQLDTSWIYLLALVQRIFWVNPFAFFLCKNIRRLQELACDEELIVNGKVDAKEYAEMLLRVAGQYGYLPGLMTGIFKRRQVNELRRRIQAMVGLHKTKNKLYFSAVLFLVSVAAVFAVSKYPMRVNVAETDPILLKMQVSMGGNEVSQPQVATRFGEAATVIQKMEGMETYFVITPAQKNWQGEKEVFFHIDYGRVENGQKVKIGMITAVTQMKKEAVVVVQNSGLENKRLKLKITPEVLDEKLTSHLLNSQGKDVTDVFVQMNLVDGMILITSESVPTLVAKQHTFNWVMTRGVEGKDYRFYIGLDADFPSNKKGAHQWRQPAAKVMQEFKQKIYFALQDFFNETDPKHFAEVIRKGRGGFSNLKLYQIGMEIEQRLREISPKHEGASSEVTEDTAKNPKVYKKVMQDYNIQGVANGMRLVPVDSQQAARRSFFEGFRSLRSGKYAAAYGKFKEATALDPTSKLSKHYKTLAGEKMMEPYFKKAVAD